MERSSEKPRLRPARTAAPKALFAELAVSNCAATPRDICAENVATSLKKPPDALVVASTKARIDAAARSSDAFSSSALRSRAAQRASRVSVIELSIASVAFAADATVARCAASDSVCNALGANARAATSAPTLAERSAAAESIAATASDAIDASSAWIERRIAEEEKNR